MSATRFLGSVDLNDATRYDVPVRTESAKPVREVVQFFLRNTGKARLGFAGPVELMRAFDAYVFGSSWSDVLGNIAAIQAELTAAALYSTEASGAQITYVEQNDDGPTQTYNVTWGECYELVTERSTFLKRTMVHVELHCEPTPV